MLPLPSENETPRDAWWTALLHKDEPRIHVDRPPAVLAPRGRGRAARRGAGGCRRARRIRAGTTARCSGWNCDADVSRARLTAALAAAGFDPQTIVCAATRARRSPTRWSRSRGFVADDDPRLGALSPAAAPPVVLGAYAVPSRRSRAHDAARGLAPEILTISPYVGGESKLPGVNRVYQTVVQRGRVRRAAGRAGGRRQRRGELHRYPDGGAADLRRAIGARFGLDPARIVCGAGSDDLIYQLCLAYGGAGPRPRHDRARVLDLRHRRHLRRRRA